MGKCNIKKACINKSHKDIYYFNQIIYEENILVPDKKPDVENIMSVVVDHEVISMRVIDTPKGTSAEGQHLTGKGISIELKLRQKIMYVSQTAVQTVHVVEGECFKSICIIIPHLIAGSKPEDLLKKKYLKAEVIVENASAAKIDERNIYKTVMLLVKIQVVPCYLLCYTENHNGNESRLYICNEDGSKKKEIACCEDYKILSPKWAPCGQRIAYICYDKHSSFLCTSDIKSFNIKQITDPYLFKQISGFSWGPDGNSILFTGCLKKNKDIFLVNLSNLEWRQLTYGENGCNSFMAKCSTNGERIGYLKAIGESSNLYIMQKNGLGTKKLTTIGNIKEFAWENGSYKIICVSAAVEEEQYSSKEDYVLGCDKKGDEVFILDTADGHKENLNISNYNLKIKNVKFSFDNEFISFIGQIGGIEDIYLYDLIRNELINLTDNGYGINIGEYDWKRDSSAIYYSSNELSYYNVYIVAIYDKMKIQVSNTTASSIKLAYRPRII